MTGSLGPVMNSRATPSRRDTGLRSGALSVALVLLFTACNVPDDSKAPADTTDTMGNTVDSETAAPVETGDSGRVDVTVTEETIGDQLLDDSWIFSFDQIHEINIKLDNDAWNALFNDPYEYVIGEVTVNGDTLSEVGVRLRGKVGSFRELSGKPKFKIDLNRFIEDQRYWGLETLSLNNSVVDCSFIKETLGYQVFEAAGVPASRTAYAYVSVNDAPYGLYVWVETPDDRFLKRHFTDPSGNLYDGKYIYYPNTGAYQMLDFGEGVDHRFGLEEGTETNNAEIREISAQYKASRGRTIYHEAMSDEINWEALFRMWLAEQWVGHNDGYCLNTNNYRVYFDPVTGLGEMIPWDLDYGFLHDYQWGMNWEYPAGNLAYECFNNAACVFAMRPVAQEFVKTMESIDWVARVDTLTEFIDTPSNADPRKECLYTSGVRERARLRNWAEHRTKYLKAFWNLDE